MRQTVRWTVNKSTEEEADARDIIMYAENNYLDYQLNKIDFILLAL